MARYSNVTTNFSGGLITDNLAGRTDIDRVANSCRKLTNFFPSLQGPAKYRQGFQLSYVDPDETDTQFRQVHLTVGKDESYRLVFTNQKLRVFDTDGVLQYQWLNTGYAAEQLNDLRFSSETSVVYICHPSHRPRKFEIKNDISYFYEVDTYIEPFLQEEQTSTRLDITKGDEVAKVESTTADFQDIYDDYIDTTGGKQANTFSKDWYVEYEVNDVWLLGKVVDSATNYPEVTGPTPTVVYVDQADFVTDINDASAQLYLLDNNVTTSGSVQEHALTKDAVPVGEVHLRTDTDIFDSSQISSWIRVNEENSSSDVLVDSSSSMTRWVKIEKYLGNEAHPVDFVRGEGILGVDYNEDPVTPNDLGFYEYGAVYKSYGDVSFEVHSSSSHSSSTLTAEITTGGQRTFTWVGGIFVITNGNTLTAADNASADDVIGNLSTALEFDVHKVDTSVDAVHSDTLGGVSANLIQPTGSISVTEIANDVTITATDGIFTATTSIDRHIRGVMPTGVVYMQIIDRTSDTEVRARLKNPVPRSGVTGGFENSGRFETFSFGAWYANNYPSDVAYFERRRVYGGTPSNPNYVFFSRLDDEDSFAPSEDDKTVLDTNGISYPLSNVNSSVRWIIAAKDLIVGTTRGIFSMSVNEYEAAVSPKTIRFQLNDEVNCKDEAYMVGTSIFFPNESGTQLLEYKYDGAIQRSNANDVSKFIFPVLTTDTIKRIAVQETPQPRIWVLTSSGVIYCLTYQRQEDYYAWSKVTIADGVPVLDLVVLRETYKSGLDQVYILVNRFGFVQHEVLSSDANINGEPTTPFPSDVDEPTVYLDSSETGVVGKNTQSYNQATKTLTIVPTHTDVFRSNRRVDVVVSGTYMGNYEIVGGKIQIQMLLGESERWTIGLKYTGKLQPMYPTWDGANKPSYGSDNARIVSSKAYLVDSSRYSIGIDGALELIELNGHVSAEDRLVSNTSDYLTQINDSTGSELLTSDGFALNVLSDYVAPPQTRFTGFDREKPLRGAYFGVDKIIDIEQSEPYPLTIVSLVTKTDLN
jgi:hypothetical protein